MATEFSRRAFLQSAAVGMGALLVAACTPAAQPSGGGEAAPASAGGDPVPALLRAGSGEEDYFNRVVDLFEQQHPDTKINRVFAPGGADYITKLDLMIAAGDPPAIVAASDKIRAALGWRPALDDLPTIVEHALKWERGLAERLARE